MTIIETQPIRLRPSDILLGALVYFVLLTLVMPLMGDPRSKDGAP